MKNIAFKLLFVIVSLGHTNAQNIERVDPPNWWVGFKNQHLGLLIKGKNIPKINRVEITPKGITVQEIAPQSNTNYLYLKLKIENEAQATNYEIKLVTDKKTIKFNYELLPRSTNNYQGLSTNDFIYLIMPDRFANANPNNDIDLKCNEKTISRDSVLSRHGGDIEGVTQHLDYIKELGATAIWLNPVQQNNQPFESYHGYAITDHYKIDSRLGTINEYKSLINTAHSKDMKIIMDVVFNHCGNEHYLYKNQPDSTCFHQFKDFTRTNYRATTLMDPYHSDYDKNLMQNAWFDKHMPDINQKNIFMADYLIQNSIWWIENCQIDAFRVDTWAYPDQDFMKNWIHRIKNEYPKFTVFGEVWEHGQAIQARFTENQMNQNNQGNMPGCIDFELYYAINDALTKDFSWTDGAARIYYTLAQDFLYQNPFNNVIFLDNHDLSRFSSMIGGNMDKFKSGIAFLLTMRGIPSMFYGTEIMMQAWSNPDAKVRIDFPGGWPEDKANKFKEENRNNRENEAVNYIKKIAHYRKNCEALTQGQLKQFVPENGVYVYFRYHSNKKVMVIMNTNNKPISENTKRYKEMIENCQEAINIINNERIKIDSQVNLNPYQTLILELINN